MKALSTMPISLGLVFMRFMNGTAFFGISRKMKTSVGILKFLKNSLHGFPLHIILLEEFSNFVAEWFAFQKFNNPQSSRDFRQTFPYHLRPIRSPERFGGIEIALNSVATFK